MQHNGETGCWVKQYSGIDCRTGGQHGLSRSRSAYNNNQNSQVVHVRRRSVIVLPRATPDYRPTNDNSWNKSYNTTNRIQCMQFDWYYIGADFDRIITAFIHCYVINWLRRPITTRSQFHRIVADGWACWHKDEPLDQEVTKNYHCTRFISTDDILFSHIGNDVSNYYFRSTTIPHFVNRNRYFAQRNDRR